MVGTDDLRQLLTATAAAGTKTVLVGDQINSPVKARGGMFAQLCTDLQRPVDCGWSGDDYALAKFVQRVNAARICVLYVVRGLDQAQPAGSGQKNARWLAATPPA